MATFTQTSAPAPGASAPPPSDPLAGQTVLDANGQATGQKGIQLTKRALKRIRIAMAKEKITPDQGDRVYAFTQTHLDPAAADAPPIRIFVDPKSFIYLHGMVLDYEETLMRQAFNFINPHSTKSCGCGSSFST